MKNSLTEQLELQSHAQYQTLCGEHDRNLKYIGEHCQVNITRQGDKFTISGKNKQQRQLTWKLILKLAEISQHQPTITEEEIYSNLTMLQSLSANQHVYLTTPRKKLTLKNENQISYLTNLQNKTINFAIGPAGTGKTYLAVAYAAQLLDQQQIDKIILVRPAVEAGEQLGFLPGDINQKFDPFLRPIYDCFHEFIGSERLSSYLDSRTIELAPIAYMRGRTLKNSFIIIDEGQNATIDQMKMCLTRIGFNTKLVINGDITQIDLPNAKKSGLVHAEHILQKIDMISFNYFTARDIVRHPLVQQIVNAYAKN